MSLTPAQRAALTLIRCERVGPATYYALVEKFGSPRAALEALPSLARRANGRHPRLPDPERIEAEIESLTALGGRFLTLEDPDYPPRLRATELPPPVLCAAGDPSLLARPVLAIVGARNASAAGRRFAADCAAALADLGWTVISGLARGIDTAAHKAAGPARTAAVVAGGLDFVFPEENAALQAAIAREGCLLSEHPVGFTPQARHFPQRNRLVSGCALGVLVVEAAAQSGSLITARQALEQGRDVFAVPGSPLDPRAKGTNQLIRTGAVLTESVSDILDVLEPQLADPPLRERPRPEYAAPDLLSPARAQPSLTAQTTSSDDTASDESAAMERRLLALLGPTPMDQDELIRQAAIPAAAAASVLLELELTGRVTRHPGSKFSLTYTGG